jgi:hypothetical protein
VHAADLAVLGGPEDGLLKINFAGWRRGWCSALAALSSPKKTCWRLPGDQEL